MKFKKRKKCSRMRGHRTVGFSAKLHKGKGSKGGKGMSGTGKRADQKKTYVIKNLYPYFGKKGFTSRTTAKKEKKYINLEEIKKKYSGAKIELKDYKILGDGEGFKAEIHAKEASKSAIEKMEKAGGKIILQEVKEKIAKKEAEKK